MVLAAIALLNLDPAVPFIINRTIVMVCASAPLGAQRHAQRGSLMLRSAHSFYLFKKLEIPHRPAGARAVLGSKAGRIS